MALLMVFAALCGIGQLTALASWSRTLRFSTLVLSVAMGAYACGVLAILGQLAWTRGVSAITHQPLSDVVVTAGYTVDPVVEEVVKILPLVVLGVGVRRVSRQLGLTDHLLVGAATGAGFALFEAVMRYGTVSRLAMGYQGGYLVNATLGGAVVVPGIGTSLTTWLPDPGQVHELLATGGAVVCMHLAWSALAGLGVGWLLRRQDEQRYLGVLPLVYACADHMHYNHTADVGPLTGAWTALELVLTWLHQRLGVLVLLAVVAAVVADRLVLSWARARYPEVLLGGERPDGWWPQPLLARATTAPPWTTLVICRFVLARRSTLYAVARDHDDTSGLALAAHVRGQLERAGDRAGWPPGFAPLRPTRRGVVRLLKSWRAVVWLLLLLPPLAYYVLGGFPATRAIQQAFTSRVGSRVVLVLAAVGLLWTGWQVWALLSARRSAVGQVSGEAVARYLIRVVTGVGALGAGVVLVVLGLGGTGEAHVVSNLHALDALGSLFLVAGLLLFLWGLFMFPPLGFLALSTGAVVLAPTAAAGAFGATAAASLLLGSLGVVLNNAAENAEATPGGRSGAGESSPSQAQAIRAQRIEELAKDPAHQGRVDAKSRREAEVGLTLEERGVLRGPIRRSPNEGAEFRDANNKDWDVKGFWSGEGKGQFDLEESMRTIEGEIRETNGVIIDTQKMSQVHIDELRQALLRRPDLNRQTLWFFD